MAASIWSASSSAGITTAIRTVPTIARSGARARSPVALTPGGALPYQCRVSTPEDPSRSEASAPAYARAGVDLDYDEGFVQEIAQIARGTFRPEVLSGIGGFAGLFKTPDRYRDPVLVASADGVGTKLKLAARLGRWDTVGIDCVAMVVNDLVVQGAEPLVFLDYVAMGRLDTKVAADALRGVAEGCRRAGCALLGGETATMPGTYAEGDLELVGFGVGVVERDRVVDGSTISDGDVLIGIGSNGLHSNGFSLVRRVVDEGIRTGAVEPWAEVEELNGSLASALLAPTRIYVKPVLNLIRDFPIKGIVHITGGGFDGNLPRVLPKGVRARLDLGSWPRPAIFDWLQRTGGIAESEMLRVFNCGIGMVLVVPPDATNDVLERLQGLGERAYRIGAIERRQPEDAAVRTVRARRTG
jgi:phosphoribosylformylglycinamidine cyclo-ligase